MKSRRWCLVLLAGLLAFGLALATAGAVERPPGDSRVVANVPAPGFPEGIAVRGNRVYVAGPAQFAHRGVSKVWAFDRVTGALVRDFVIQGQDPNQDHGIAGLAFDGNGRLYVADQQQGVVRIDVGSGAQSLYAGPLPDLKPCNPLLVPPPCSPTLLDRPPLGNDLVFDPAGFLYVTDFFQATIWRIPPGGGAPQVWFQDARLDRGLGPNGIRLSPDGTSVVFAVTGPPGDVYRLPLAQPTAANLQSIHTYLLEGPDNLAFGQSGRLYVALALTNQVSVLAPAGNEVARYSGPAANQPQPTPWDAPAGIAFDNSERRLLVANHALVTGTLLPDRFVVFDVYVDDHAQPLAEPLVP